MKLQIRFTGTALAAALLFSPLLPLTAMAATPAPTTPLTHELLWMMKRVGAPAVSPDGKWVVFPVLEPSYEPDKEASDLWLVPADGSEAPHRITNTRAPERDVAWSPDSRSIAFATRREGDGNEQIYILDLASGGEARRLTDLSTGASSPKWRPDGKAILFESTVYPDAPDDDANRKFAAERKARTYNVRVYEHFPVRQWSQWLDERQPTVLVQSLEPGAKPKDILSASALAHNTGFAGVADPMSAGSSLAPIWSPDAQHPPELRRRLTEVATRLAGPISAPRDRPL
jgi:dipeptidyl aminopeptidase/acylaminoacyl peptidase